MECVSEGQLRAFVDRELGAGEAAAVDRHVSSCGACAAALEVVRRDARMVARLIAPEPLPASDTGAALRRAEARWRTEAAVAGHLAGETAGPARVRRIARPALAGALITALLVAMLSLTPLQSFANALTRQFRVQQFAAVTIRVPNMQSLPGPGVGAPGHAEMPGMAGGGGGRSDATGAPDSLLRRLGTLTSSGTAQSRREVASLDAARQHFATDSARNGGVLKTVPADKLPPGVGSLPVRYLVGDTVSGTYVLDVAAAKEQAAATGKPELANLPWPDVGQLTFKYEVPASVAVIYGDNGNGFGYLQLASPTLTVPTELDVNAFRAAVLALPGLPADTVAQVKAVKDWQKTLIVPVPSDASTENVTIGGNPGLLIMDGKSRGGVVMWQASGVLYAVGGHLTRDQLLAAANSMR